VDQRQEIARDSKCVDAEGNAADVVALLQFWNLDFKKNVQRLLYTSAYT
jgi:hypothetical protein